MPQHREFYVTDTHPFVWFLADDVRLGLNARTVFDRADSGEAAIIIPAVTLAEAAYLAGKGRIEAKADQMFSIVETASNYIVYPLDLTIVRKSIELPSLSEIHDRSIVATARHLGLPLITRDEKIRDSGLVPTIW